MFRSHHQRQAQPSDSEALDDGSSVDDSIPIVLQRTRIRRDLAAAGGSGELSIDRRTNPGVEHKPDQQQGHGGGRRNGLGPSTGDSGQCRTRRRGDQPDHAGERHSPVAITMHVAHHGDQGSVVDGGQGRSLDHCAEYVGAVNHRRPQHRDQCRDSGEVDHGAPPSRIAVPSFGRRYSGTVWTTVSVIQDSASAGSQTPVQRSRMLATLTLGPVRVNSAASIYSGASMRYGD